MAPFVTAVVEDAYEDGKGRLDAKIFGLVSVAHARGLEVDRGEAQRYLAELPWCPMALVHNRQLRFRETAEDRIRVSVHDDATSVDLLFDADGDITGARTDARPRGDFSQGWAGHFEAYRDFGPGPRTVPG